MNIVDRSLEQVILKYLKPGKAIIITGARRTGKTFLVKQILEKQAEGVLYLNAEDYASKQLLLNRDVYSYKNLVGDKTILAIDEAQVIPDIGLILKLFTDELPNLKIIATGSSAFDLLNLTGEPLTGRSYHFNLFPLSQQEIGKYENIIETRYKLEERLIYGAYPEIIQMKDNEERMIYLINLVNTYLLKDILVLDGLRNSSKIMDLLKLLALQVGSEVSYNELGNQLGMSKNTVEKYLDLLSKVFVVFKLGAYSKNLRKEISKGCKWYFYDNGVRNAIISNFNPLSLRTDIGQLWENYMISEIRKFNYYKLRFANYYFWRTYDQQEIDLLEEISGSLKAYEIKWQDKKFKAPKAWSENYPETPVALINNANYLDFIT